jgi:hypothetical protein
MPPFFTLLFLLFSLLSAESALSRANSPAVVAKVSHPLGATNSPTAPRKLPLFLEDVFFERID